MDRTGGLGREPQRAHEPKLLDDLEEVVRRRGAGRLTEPDQGAPGGVTGGREQRVEPEELIVRESPDQGEGSPLPRVPPGLPGELLHGVEGGGDDAPAPHLLEQGLDQRRPRVGHRGHARDPAQQLAPGGVEGPKAEDPADLREVLAAGRVPARGVRVHRLRVLADLRRQVAHHLLRRPLVRPQGPAGEPEQCEEHGEPEAVARATAPARRRELFLGEGVVAGHEPVVEVDRQRVEAQALRRGEDLAPRHLLGPGPVARRGSRPGHPRRPLSFSLTSSRET